MPNWSDFFPDAAYAGAFGTGTPQEEATRAPTPVDKAVGQAGKIAMIPGQAYNSQTPVTSDQMVGPATDLASFVTLGSGAMPAEADALRMGIKAYHGSPHDFDRFDLSKIGTGEGAQAYGHGLYFAEHEPVAKAYRDQLSRTDSTANFYLQRAGGDSEKALREWDSAVANSASSASDPAMMRIRDIISRGGGGRMYEVDINADPAHFLDWDKPLSQMSPEVQKKLNDAWLAHPDVHANQTGGQIYESSRIVPGDYRDPMAASKTLRDAGIPGIKYLDQGSRSAGEGSHNYVVFDDNLIDILRKYGWAGIAALPALQSREDHT